jgi:glycosyltransferase involved in cell wall biosynthesis
MGVTTELVISTYNSPGALRLCMATALRQDPMPDGICIADDGSGPETAAVVADLAARAPVPVRHVWHEDRGFEKGAILNRAIATSGADYLVFTDGDVLMAPGFVGRHRALARRGRFVSGSLIRLGAAATATVTEAMVADGTATDRRWLAGVGALAGLSSWLKTAPLPLPLLGLVERLLPLRRSMMGSNASAFRDDLLAVNGYDERIKYGGQDKDLGERMKLAGMSGRHARFTAVAVHLDHPRGYDRPEVRARNRAIRAETKALRRAVTPYGIVRAG